MIGTEVGIYVAQVVANAPLPAVEQVDRLSTLLSSSLAATEDCDPRAAEQ